MSAAFAEVKHSEHVIRRISLGDLDLLANWLIGRIQERHAEASPQAVMGWLRGCLSSNSMWFVRTDHAVALAEIVRVPLEPQPICQEHFVLHQGGDWHDDEAGALYPAMASWAANQNASTLYVNAHSDVTRNMIASRLGKLTLKSRPHISLGRLD
jgi:hypothetical protein